MRFGILKNHFNKNLPRDSRIRQVEVKIEWLVQELMNPTDMFDFLVKHSYAYLEHYRLSPKHKKSVYFYSDLIEKVCVQYGLKHYRKGYYGLKEKGSR